MLLTVAFTLALSLSPAPPSRPDVIGIAVPDGVDLGLSLAGAGASMLWTQRMGGDLRTAGRESEARSLESGPLPIGVMPRVIDLAKKAFADE